MLRIVASRDDVVERLRRSVELTVAEGTARIRFTPHRIVGRSFERILAERYSARTVAAVGLARRVVKFGLAVLPASALESDFSSGEIDFMQQRCVYNAGEFWKLFAPGREFVGCPGEWESDEHDGIGLDEPFWLLELVKATVDAVDEGTESVRGEDCRHYVGRADFGLATSGLDRAMVSPVRSEQLDLARLDIEVWLDDHGRIRRATFRGLKSVTSLELFGFGEPEPIALPSPDEILPDVMDSPHPSAQPPAAGTAAPITPMPGSLATQMAGEAPPAVNEPVVAVMEAASAELLAEMQGAPERTMAAGTARLSYDADVESIGWAPLVDAIAAHEPDPTVTGAQGKAWSLVGRAIKAGDAAVSRMVTGSNEGVIDFASGGALVSRHAIGREYSRYYAPGVQLDRDRAAGSWRDRPRRQFEGSRAYTPMWLTELPRGATDVTLVGSDLIDGQPCRHLRASADLQLAARRSRHGMETTLPGHHEHDQVLFEAWLDQEGRLRRVRHVLATWTCEVRFSHFGEIPPLEPPTVTG